MPVVVARADADQHHARRDGGEELRRRVPAAVVRHLEHVRPQRRVRGQQLRLRRDLDVAGQQHGAGRRRRAHHHRGVVDLGAVVRVDVLGRVVRTEHVQGESGPHEPGAGSHRDHPRTGRAGLTRDPVERPPRLPHRPDGDRADRPVAQRSRKTADVVGVQVADQDDRECGDAEPIEAGVDRPVDRPGVDQHGPPPLTGREHHRVALPDVARHHRPLRRRPAGAQHPGRHQHEQQADGRREEQRTDAPGAGEHHEREHDQGQQRGAGDAGRPRDHAARHGRRAVRHGDEPTDGRAREPDASLRGRRRHGGDDRCRHTQHRRRRHRGRRQQVRHHRHHADAAAQPGDQRCRRQAGRGGHGQRLGHTRRNSPLPHPRGPARHDEHERRGGHHRQAEPGIGRQCRIHEQQPEHRRGKRRHGRPTATEREREQHDAPHHRGPQHAR
jgi:hypothetical protein